MRKPNSGREAGTGRWSWMLAAALSAVWAFAPAATNAQRQWSVGEVTSAPDGPAAVLEGVAVGSGLDGPDVAATARLATESPARRPSGATDVARRPGSVLHRSATDVGGFRPQTTQTGSGFSGASSAPAPSCDGTCRINILFVYEKRTLCGRSCSGPGNAGELRTLVRRNVDSVNRIWARSKLDAELNLVGVVEVPDYLDHWRAQYSNDEHVRSSAEWVSVELRLEHRADLIYGVLPEFEGAAGAAWYATPFDLTSQVWGFPVDLTVSGWPVSLCVAMEQSGIPMDYTADGYCESWGEFSQLEVAGGPDGYVTSRFLFDPTVLAHEIGHNLGLAHDPRTRRMDGTTSEFPGGQGFVSGGIRADGREWQWATIMSYTGTLDTVFVHRYSTSEERASAEDLYIPSTSWNVDLPAAIRQKAERDGIRIGGREGEYEAAGVARRVAPYFALRNAPWARCIPKAKVLSLGGYEVRSCFERERSGDSVTSDALDYGLASDESGLLYFFDRDNAEILIKVLDGCGVNGHRWVFVAPVTDLALNLEVREVSTGRKWRYRNPGGETADPRGDTGAFPCSASASGPAALATPAPLEPARRLASGSTTDCIAAGPALTLSGGYKVSMCYETYDGAVGQARDWGLDSSQSALLYFFDRNNVEVLIKVLDGCGVNGHRWVFVAPVTDLAFNLHVESPAGERWIHRNRLGQTADAAGDTSAFPCGASA